jgi:hypothetical protein
VRHWLARRLAARVARAIWIEESGYLSNPVSWENMEDCYRLSRIARAMAVTTVVLGGWL